MYTVDRQAGQVGRPCRLDRPGTGKSGQVVTGRKGGQVYRQT